MSKDGIVYIEVPGLKVLAEGGYGGDFLRYIQNAHVRGFSLETLTNVMMKYGFELHVGNGYVHALYKYVGENKPITINYYEDHLNFLMQMEIKYLTKLLKAK